MSERGVRDLEVRARVAWWWFGLAACRLTRCWAGVSLAEHASVPRAQPGALYPQGTCFDVVPVGEVTRRPSAACFPPAQNKFIMSAGAVALTVSFGVIGWEVYQDQQKKTAESTLADGTKVPPKKNGWD